MRRATVLSLVLALAACGGDATAPPPSFTGTWTANTASEGLLFSVNIVAVEQSGGQITGSGTFTVGQSGGLAFTVTGTHAHPSVSITMHSTGFEDSNVTGTFADRNTVTGTLNGSGFSNVALTLQRQ